MKVKKVGSRQNQNQTEKGIDSSDIELVMSAVYRRIEKNYSDFRNTTTWLAKTFARTISNKTIDTATINVASLEKLNTSINSLKEKIRDECQGGCEFGNRSERNFFYGNDDGNIEYPYTGEISFYEFEFFEDEFEDPPLLKNKTKQLKSQLKSLFSNKNGLEMTKKSIDTALKSTSESGTNGIDHYVL